MNVTMNMSDDLTKYNVAAAICGKVFKSVVSKIQTEKEYNVPTLSKYGNDLINEECSKIYKKSNEKGIAYPVSISLNNCVGNYVYEVGHPTANTIQDGDLVKIELGVHILGCTSMLAETIVVANETRDTCNDSMQDHQKYITLLDELANCIIKMIKPGETNDEIRRAIESKCTEHDCFPLENCCSYQHLDGHIKTQDSKYVILNHTKYYDDEDNLIVEPNVCYEFEKGEVYTIDLTIVPNQADVTQEHVYTESHPPHIYRFNEYFYNLKLKSAREFCSKVKKVHGNGAFVLHDYSTTKDKLGLKECLDNGILDAYNVLYCNASTEKTAVYKKKFTIVISDKKCMQLKYN